MKKLVFGMKERNTITKTGLPLQKARRRARREILGLIPFLIVLDQVSLAARRFSALVT